MAVLLPAVDRNADMGAAHTAFYRGFRLKRHPRQPQGVQPGQKSRWVRVELQQGPGQHISGRAHVAFQI